MSRFARRVALFAFLFVGISGNSQFKDSPSVVSVTGPGSLWSFNGTSLQTALASVNGAGVFSNPNGSTTSLISLSNWGFSVPGQATVLGFTVEIRKRCEISLGLWC
jgi:hypothetical protein